MYGSSSSRRRRLVVAEALASCADAASQPLQHEESLVVMRRRRLDSWRAPSCGAADVVGAGLLKAALTRFSRRDSHAVVRAGRDGLTANRRREEADEAALPLAAMLAKSANAVRVMAGQSYEPPLASVGLGIGVQARSSSSSSSQSTTLVRRATTVLVMLPPVPTKVPPMARI